MKRLLPFLIAIGIILSACGTASAQPALTGTPTITPTATQIPTSMITPLPTIATFTPTFDISTIVTVTPAEKAECPRENSDLDPLFPIRTKENFFIENSADILNYLNEGGGLEKAAERLELAIPFHGDVPIFEDVTGDMIPDLVFVDYTEEPKLHVFSCNKGKYRDVSPDIKDDLTGYSTAVQATAKDLNQNGIFDILLKTSCSRGLGCTSLFILEWNGSEFINRIEPRELFEGSTERNVLDTNNDGTLEVVITQDVNGDYAYFMGFPWRISKHTYMWNGSQYALKNIQYEKPEYRFQSIQDADRSVLLKSYDLSQDLYKMAIEDKNLLSYSRELSEHMAWLLDNPLSLGVATLPASDPAEYPSLAAYAYYRIMLLHLIQGREAEAASTYQTLQDTFGADPYAAPYVEMATEFLEVYQSTHKMYDGCAAAIQYAAEHPQILTPLGSDYHGWQSHIYVPTDVCPFR